MEGTYVILMPPWRAGETPIQRVLALARVEIWLLGERGWRNGFVVARVTHLWHASPLDPREHITVEIYYNYRYIGTWHVVRHLQTFCSVPTASKAIKHITRSLLGGGWGIVVAEVRVSVAADGSFGALGVEEDWGGAKFYFCAFLVVSMFVALRVPKENPSRTEIACKALSVSVRDAFGRQFPSRTDSARAAAMTRRHEWLMQQFPSQTDSARGKYLTTRTPSWTDIAQEEISRLDRGYIRPGSCDA
ncbi:uncharacterized protein STEHIDRAFT_116843 [Stereum hirsutum FP-91666 SS1]|uniref:Uncharacterized protein n=1 Tax=Stereum hirsutum (strain FP-91666) TaxID=721885 RepID=R7RXC5_STEHR|nr:uncharacterized protein STEHIDRAFT_116843 [Stereum hirsutum FP-91666 SS1]EIM79017.1 hypothetical protein STEHIDRAFT_116843 [Stereum hirsutum FP-91666 SS1]